MMHIDFSDIGRPIPTVADASEERFSRLAALDGYARLYELGTEVAVIFDSGTAVDGTHSAGPEAYILAARGRDAEGRPVGAVLISNPSAQALPLDITADGRLRTCRLTDVEHTRAEVRMPEMLPAESFVLLEYEL